MIKIAHAIACHGSPFSAPKKASERGRPARQSCWVGKAGQRCARDARAPRGRRSPLFSCVTECATVHEQLLRKQVDSEFRLPAGTCLLPGDLHAGGCATVAPGPASKITLGVFASWDPGVMKSQHQGAKETITFMPGDSFSALELLFLILAGTLSVVHGQIQVKPRPLARLAFAVQLAAMLLHNPMADCQSQTRALARRLGCEERIKHLLLYFP